MNGTIEESLGDGLGISTYLSRLSTSEDVALLMGGGLVLTIAVACCVRYKSRQGGRVTSSSRAGGGGGGGGIASVEMAGGCSRATVDASGWELNDAAKAAESAEEGSRVFK